MRAKDVLSKKLRILRVQRGWTQRELAKRVGVSAGTITSIEIGRQFPSEPLIGVLAEVFAIEETDFFKLKTEAVGDSARAPISERRAKVILKDVADALGYHLKSCELEAA